MRNDYGYALTMMGRYAEAVSAMDRALELDSAFQHVFSTIGVALFEQGRVDEVIARGAAVGGIDLVPVIRAYRQKGQTREVAAAVERTRRTLGRHRHGTEFVRGIVHGAAGNADSAFYWLNRAVDSRDGSLSANSVPCENTLVELHDDPRFEALLARMGVARCRKTLTKQ